MSLIPKDQRVPVFSGPRCLEYADQARLRVLMQAPNIEVVRRHKDKRIVELQMLSMGDESALKDGQGNPRRHSHDHEVDRTDWTGNPNRCWTLKAIRRRDRDVFRRAVLDCCPVR